MAIPLADRRPTPGVKNPCSWGAATASRLTDGFFFGWVFSEPQTLPFGLLFVGKIAKPTLSHEDLFSRLNPWSKQ